MAALQPSVAAISGQVKIDQYVKGGYRRYRFISHPFSNIMSLIQIQSYIHVTGAGVNANVFFKATSSNALSAFRLDSYMSNSPMDVDTGWKAFHKILVRGCLKF